MNKITKDIDIHLVHKSQLTLESTLKNNRKILLANENSMIDTYRIETVDNGKLCPQSVNLEEMTGNNRILSLIKIMIKNKEGIFFPGTLLRDFGDHVLPVMPVIINGEIVCERVKQTGLAYVDDYVALANTLLGTKYAKKMKKFDGQYHTEPMKTLQKELDKEVKKLRKNSLVSFSVKGHNILPVICNELPLMHGLYKGDKVDVVLHSCSNLYMGNEERKESYIKHFNKMYKKGLIADNLLIATSEIGDIHDRAYNSFTGRFMFEKGKLIELNQGG